MTLGHLTHHHRFHFPYDTEFFHHIIDTIHSIDIPEICHASDLFDAFSSHFIVTIFTFFDAAFFWITSTLQIIDFYIFIIFGCFEVSFAVFAYLFLFFFYLWDTLEKEILEFVCTNIRSG